MFIKCKTVYIGLFFLLGYMFAFGTPDLDQTNYGINSAIQNTINSYQGNKIQLSTPMGELAKSKTTLEQEQYNEDLQRDSDYLATKYAWWGQMARGFTVAVQQYTQSLQFVQDYPREMIKKWNLPPQFDMTVDPNDQGKLVLQFSEPMYMGF